MGARILYRDSQGRDGAIELEPSTPVYVGRALECAIRTDDAMVSRKHSMIRMEHNRFCVEDLGSSNGTHVNDVRVTKQPLAHNDVVRCGSLWLRYIEEGPVAGAATAEPGNPMAHAAPVAAPAANAARPPVAPAAPGPFKPPTVPPVDGGSVSGSTADRRLQSEPLKEESSVVIDFGGESGSQEAARLKMQLVDVQAELEALQAKYDREAADGKRTRADAITLRDRIEELKGGLQDREDMIASHTRVAEELREELKQTRDELATARSEMGEVRDSVSARERQLERSQGDLVRLKEELEDLNRQLGEVSRTKDEGWRKLNDQLGEIEHLREVITEQERMLEERRVGLVSQEEVIKELRGEKERLIKGQASLRAERDELRTDSGRQNAQIAAIDEENKRLSELLAQLQSRAATGAVSPDQSMKLTEDLKNARVEVRKLESDRDRLQEVNERAEREVSKLEERVAELEVELRDADERREVASSTKSVAEAAMAKAETRAHKSEEEAIDAAKARDVAMSAAEDARREADRLRRTVEKLESGASKSDELEELGRELEGTRGELQTALQRASDAERQLSALKAELEAAQVEARGYKTGAFIVDVVDGAREDKSEVTAQVAGHEELAAAAERSEKIAARAQDVYDEINDILSELRNNIMIVGGEFGDLSNGLEGQSTDSVRIIKEAIDTLVGNAEDAKGILRGLKELVDFDA